MRRLLPLLLLSPFLAPCGHSSSLPAPSVPAVIPFEAQKITSSRLPRAFPSDRVKDREGWARDLWQVMQSHDIPPTHGNVCQILAIIEQESGYNPNPTVPGMGNIVDRWITEQSEKYGKAGGWLMEQAIKGVLDTMGEGQSRTFYERLRAAKTEKEVDQIYRDVVAHYRDGWPRTLSTVEFLGGTLTGTTADDLNPITTAGCMQVKVDFAREHAHTENIALDGVRDDLYTRQGCLHYGVVHLMGYQADYSRPIYRFADYNAGHYASRNAALQGQLAKLTGQTLALDGDLLIYDSKGKPSSKPSRTLKAAHSLAPKLGLTEMRITHDFSREKSSKLEETDSWEKIKALYRTEAKDTPSYARMPEVQLNSAKIQGDKTTAWFAQSVQKRYESCLTRLGKK